MAKNRILNFGKYKGKEVKAVILSHIGYIMWCFENIKQFRLTDEEQAIYDAVAIMIKKEGCQMTFPTELMYKHVKDREALEQLRTPFTCVNGYTLFRRSDKDNPVCRSVEEYAASKRRDNDAPKGFSVEGLGYLASVMNAEAERAHFNGESDDEIFGGWGSMSDY